MPEFNVGDRVIAEGTFDGLRMHHELATVISTAGSVCQVRFDIPVTWRYPTRAPVSTWYMPGMYLTRIPTPPSSGGIGAFLRWLDMRADHANVA